MQNKTILATVSFYARHVMQNKSNPNTGEPEKAEKLVVKTDICTRCGTYVAGKTIRVKVLGVGTDWRVVELPNGVIKTLFNFEIC